MQANRVFADTSALCALLVADDKDHAAAEQVFARLVGESASLVTSCYILSETYSLLARRIGLVAVRRFRQDFSGLLFVVWVDEETNNKGLFA